MIMVLGSEKAMRGLRSVKYLFDNRTASSYGCHSP